MLLQTTTVIQILSMFKCWGVTYGQFETCENNVSPSPPICYTLYTHIYALYTCTKVITFYTVCKGIMILLIHTNTHEHTHTHTQADTLTLTHSQTHSHTEAQARGPCNSHKEAILPSLTVRSST